MTSLIIRFLSILTLFAEVAAPVAVVYLLLSPNSRLGRFVRKQVVPLSFFVALTATAGSLFFSLGAGFLPCELCWYQRIFMYPQAFLWGMAWWRRESAAVNYAMPLIAVGWLVSLYHNYIYYLGVHATSCSLEARVSCITPYFTEFGYIGIPVMALTAFTLLGLLAAWGKLGQPSRF